MPRDIGFRPAILSPAFSRLAALVCVFGLAGCYLLPPVRFNAEAAAIADEARSLFPPGASAMAFERWFRSRAGSGFMRDSTKSRDASGRKECEPRTMRLQRIEGCVNQLIVSFCVDAEDKIGGLEFQDGSYC